MRPDATSHHKRATISIVPLRDHQLRLKSDR